MRKAPPRGLRYCAVEDCPFFALTGEPHCVRHRRGHSVADDPHGQAVGEAEE